MKVKGQLLSGNLRADAAFKLFHSKHSQRHPVNTGVSLPPDVVELPRAARKRQAARGGKASASAIIVESVRATEAALRQELLEQ